MGGGDSELVVKAVLDATGFTKGSQTLKSAINGISKNVKSISQTAQRSFNQLGGIARRIVPSIIGVGSAYQIITRAVSAFMQENKNLSATMSNVWSSLGGLLGPIITKIINWVATAVSWFLQFLKLLGVASANANKTAKAAGGGAAALQKTLAGFDELNLLQDNSGGGGGGGKSDFNPADLPDWLKALAKALRDKMWDEAADIIIGHINKLIAKVKEKAYEFGKKCGEYFAGAVHIIARAIKEIDWKGIGQAIARFINGLFEDVDPKELGAIIVGKITIAFGIVTGFLEELKGKQLAEVLSGIVTGAMNTLSKAIQDADFLKIGRNIREFFENIHWDEIREAFKTLLISGIQAILDALWGLLNMPGDPPNLFENIHPLKLMIAFRDIIVKAVQDAINLLWNIVGFPGTPEDFWKNIKSGELQEKFAEILSSAVQGAIDALWAVIELPGESPKLKEVLNDLVIALTNLSSNIISFVTQIFNGVFKSFLEYSGPATGGIAEFITNLANALSGLIEKAQTGGLTDFLNNLWSVIGEMVTATISIAADVIPAFIEQIGNALAKIDYSTISHIVTNLKKLYTDVLLPMVTNIKESGAVESVFNAIVGFLNLVAAVIDTVLPSLISFVQNFIVPFATMNLAGIQGIAEGFSTLFKNLVAVIKGEETLNEAMDNMWESYYGQIESVETLSGGYGELSQSTHDCGTEFERLQKCSDGVNLPDDMVVDYNQAFDNLIASLTSGTSEIEGTAGANEELAKKVYAVRDAFLEYAKTHPEVWGDSEKTKELTMELAQITAEYTEILAEQGIIINKNGEVVQHTAEVVTEQANATKEGAQAQEEAAKAVVAANDALNNQPQAAEEAGQGFVELGTEAETGTGTVETEVSDMEESVVTDFNTMTEESLAKIKELSDGALSSVSELVDTVTHDLGDVETLVTGKTEAINSTVSAALETLKTAVSNGFSSLKVSVANSMTSIHSVISTKFSYISASAYYWGSDLIINMTNGIIAAYNSLASTIAQVAAMIRSYLGFSEPEKGPLSDFHTFMPDMMKLMAKGIEDNIPLAAKAASDVAEAVSDEIQGGDYSLKGVGDGIDVTMDKFSDKIVSGFTDLMERLQSIADNVVFSMPDVAGGGILPYGVSDIGWGDKESDNEAVMDAIDELRGLITDFRDAVENMQWVAQFGDLRMLSAQISKIQKQTERARG